MSLWASLSDGTTFLCEVLYAEGTDHQFRYVCACPCVLSRVYSFALGFVVMCL